MMMQRHREPEARQEDADKPRPECAKAPKRDTRKHFALLAGPLVFLFAGLLACFFAPGSAQAQQLVVTEAWVRATVSGQTATGAFMKLTAQAPLALVAVRSAISPRAELHEMRHENDVMTMRRVERLPLKRSETTLLAPGGLHIMLMELAAPLRAGDVVELTLVVEDENARRTEYPLRATVRALDAPQP
ncbi:MAG: copper chaperone PCu(A)C [Zoogloeaceae bacterium]|jgi:copper(I)-binding protein|nr:copper chaperone PCu(A)C [Zoogloeaceae bacterium]